MNDKFHPIQYEVQGTLGLKLNNPFEVKISPLAEIAVRELQDYLINQTDWLHDFGLGPHKTEESLGKMFGVLVVANQNGELGYLAAFSGKLAGRNNHRFFVPPVYDMLDEQGFFRIGEEELNQLNRSLQGILQSEDYTALKEELYQANEQRNHEIGLIKAGHKEKKEIRKRVRIESQDMESEERDAINKKLNTESSEDHLVLKNLKREWKGRIEKIEEEMESYKIRIEQLKVARKTKSLHLQKQLFEQYQFYDEEGNRQSLKKIFEDQGIPPSGAGECAAVKLFQYAFQQKLKPIALAEFWWGIPPVSEIRKHKNFYPSCRGKCGPILKFMLANSAVESLEFMEFAESAEDINILYEDQSLIVISKPPGLLSVPGRFRKDSVLSRIKSRYEDLTGPVIVHRLDMATSGIMVIARDLDAYRNLQKEFIERRVFKRYVALLEGEIEETKGVVNLPLRVDLDDRPRQLVCFEHGKPAVSRWERIWSENGLTKVYFYPETGRTHQLRVHAAHHKGLASPILGDRLYGHIGKRLCLHAEFIRFQHPESKEWVEFSQEANFD